MEDSDHARLSVTFDGKISNRKTCRDFSKRGRTATLHLLTVVFHLFEFAEKTGRKRQY